MTDDGFVWQCKCKLVTIFDGFSSEEVKQYCPQCKTLIKKGGYGSSDDENSLEMIEAEDELQKDFEEYAKQEQTKKKGLNKNDWVKDFEVDLD